MERYSAAVEGATTPRTGSVATNIFREDLDEGYVTVLAEMIAGAGFSPGLGRTSRRGDRAVAGIREQAIETIVAESPLASLVPVDDAAHAVVALYLGLEMLSHLDGDRDTALRLFDRCRSADRPLRHTRRKLPEGRRTMDVVTGAFSYSGRGNRAAPARHTGARCVRSPAIRNTADSGARDRRASARLLRRARPRTRPRGRHHPLQHVLGALRGRLDEPRASRSRTPAYSSTRRGRRGVQRIVHISITHPTIESPLRVLPGQGPRGAGAGRDRGLRTRSCDPRYLFGNDGVLINNIAWLLRRLPVFAVGGRGEYRIRPDPRRRSRQTSASPPPANPTAASSTRSDRNGRRSSSSSTQIRAAVGSRARVVRVPGALLPPLAAVLNRALHDVLLTRDEYDAMADGLADTDGPRTAPTALSDWFASNTVRPSEPNTPTSSSATSKSSDPRPALRRTIWRWARSRS